MVVNIDVKQVGLVLGGVIAGIAINTLCVKKAKKDLRKEIIDEHANCIKQEIKRNIEKNTNVDEIKKEIKKEISDSIIEDTLEEIKKTDNEFMAKVSLKINKFETKIDRMEEEVVNFDKHVGELVRGSITSIMSIFGRRGDYFEI